jgi:tartrate dehydrogenase/decarboxylase/D-malate dehydrogenase
VVEAVAAEFPDVTVERLLVDAAAMDLVRRPDEFDVLVASNRFADVLTDLAAAVTGSLGLAPPAGVDPGGDDPGTYEPVHDSAPDIAGEGTANPLATALSFADLGEPAVADALERAVRDQLADPDAPRTPDPGGRAGTETVAADLRARL